MRQLYQPGEHQIGRYRVQFTRFSDGKWNTHGPWMRAIITNRRLIVLPDDVRQGDVEPLMIPASDIMRVWSIGLGRRDGGVIALHSGDLLYFYVDWSQSGMLVRDIRAMLLPSITGRSRAAGSAKRYVH